MRRRENKLGCGGEHYLVVYSGTTVALLVYIYTVYIALLVALRKDVRKKKTKKCTNFYLDAIADSMKSQPSSSFDHKLSASSGLSRTVIRWTKICPPGIPLDGLAVQSIR